MDTFDPNTFEMKFNIADIGTDLYIQGDGKFHIKDIAGQLNIDPSEIFNYFPNKTAILEFYYASLVIRYEMMIEEIDGFESYSLSEKLSNFIFTSFDMLQEKHAFVEATFNDLILKSYQKTKFEKELERITQHFFEEDSHISMSSAIVLSSYFYTFLRRQYLELIQFWLNDSTEDKELSMELVDKLTTVLQELMYNAVFDKGIDLAKFLISNRKEFLGNIPIIKQFCQKIEIR